jgi:thiol-disulfide isomerase/thioredoxin
LIDLFVSRFVFYRVIDIKLLNRFSLIVFLVLLSSLLSGCFESSDRLWGDAPDFTLTTVDDETFNLSDNIGKIIVLDFMATWCVPCLSQMGELEEVVDEFGNDVLVVSIDLEKSDTAEDVRDVFGNYVDKWTFVLDSQHENVGYKYQISVIPKIVIIDENGNIYNQWSGLTSKESLVEAISKLKEI